ncbi:MAG: hypothetical protein MMC33_010259 [Icmadophila ericetorum]|nr:hypothetical protein [Icmadophila ericetorum]
MSYRSATLPRHPHDHHALRHSHSFAHISTEISHGSIYDSPIYVAPLQATPFPQLPYAPYPYQRHRPYGFRPPLRLRIPRPLNPLAPTFQPASPSPGPSIDITIPGVLSSLIITYHPIMVALKLWYHEGPNPQVLPGLATLPDLERWTPHRVLRDLDVDWDNLMRRLREEANRFKCLKGPGRLEDFVEPAVPVLVPVDGGANSVLLQVNNHPLTDQLPTPPQPAQQQQPPPQNLQPLQAPTAPAIPPIHPLADFFPLLDEIYSAANNPQGFTTGTPFEILWELDCYTLFNECYREPKEGKSAQERKRLEAGLRRLGLRQQAYRCFDEFSKMAVRDVLVPVETGNVGSEERDLENYRW